MITITEMKKAAKHQVKVMVYMDDGTIKTFEGYCKEYMWPEPDEDEHHNITVNQGGILYELNDYEIKSIEILD